MASIFSSQNQVVSRVQKLLTLSRGYYAKVPIGRSVEVIIISVDVIQGRLRTAVGDQMDVLESRISAFSHPLTVIYLSS